MSVTLNYDSDFYEDDAIKLGMLQWIVFKKESTDGKMEDWLKKYRPSQVCRKDGIGWIAVHPQGIMTDPDLKCDVVGLREGWSELKMSGKMITYHEMCDLAQRYSMLSGKWFFYAQVGANVDQAWRVVADAMVSGNLNMSCGARVSTYDPDNCEGPIHSVYICNDDFTDVDQIIKLEQQIRDLGIYTRLMYKPDIYTALGIYRRNKWDIRPTIYTSDWHVIGCRSVIDTLFRRAPSTFRSS